jgi:hypothetical protein
MNIKFLLIALSAAAFSSCSTAYKSGQTPDDVYYSPIRTVEEDYDKETSRLDPEERQIRMETRDRRWRDLDRDYDYDRRYDPYNYGCCSGYYYNPFYYPAPVYFYGLPVVPKNTTPRTTSLASYNNFSLPALNPKTGAGLSNSTRPYNNSNRNTNYVRKIFQPNNSNDNSTESNSRTYSPSSNSSNSNSSKSGSISRPARRGN